MQGLKRRIVYVSSYEIIGMVISSVGLALLVGDSVEHTGTFSDDYYYCGNVELYLQHSL